MAATVRVVATLGGRRVFRVPVAGVDELRARVRKGLPFDAVTALARALDVDLRTLARVLGIPERTLARRRHERRLRADESDRLLRVARLAALAEETLGGKAHAARWLRRPNRALGNAVPLERIDTDLGARQIEDLLGRIAHGVYS